MENEDAYEKPETETEEKAPEKPGAGETVKSYFRSLFDMRSNMLSYDELHEMMEENTVIHGANMWILMLAILIASIGLNVNSTAVIIGAMLISPLMSGILTIGYSLAIRDLDMLRHAATRFGTQVVISLVTSTIYFSLSPLNTATSEMIARTSPTIWDVLIALFGGIAGSIGNTRKKTSNVIPGVAIATALMPPLCTVGYGIATRQGSFILGAFYLFAINTLFIALSALIVTKLLGVPCHRELDARRQKRINRIITALIIIAVIPSTVGGAYTVYLSVLERNVNSYLGTEFVFADTQLVQSSADNKNRVISVSLVGNQLSDERISELEAKLDDYDLPGYTLHVTQNKTVEGADGDKVTIAVQENTIRDLQSKLDEEIKKNDELIDRIDNSIDCKSIAERTADVFKELRDVRVGILYGDDGVPCIYLSAGSLTPFSSSETELLKNYLMTESGLDKVELDIGEIVVIPPVVEKPSVEK